MAVNPMDAVLARLETLERENARLSDELATMKAATRRGRRSTGSGGSGAANGATTSRRSVLTLGLGAAATVGAGTLLTSQPAAAADNGNLTIGIVNQGEHSTELRYDGASALTGVMLLANDGTIAASTTAYKSALGGWAAGGAAGVTNGVYGFNATSGGIGVVGNDTGAGSSGKGVMGRSTNGTGVFGYSTSTSANIRAIFGQLNTTTPGSNASAVQGQNLGTNANGFGVYGSHAGGGAGIQGSSASGFGAVGVSTNGIAMRATSTTGIGFQATTSSTSANASVIQGILTTTSPGANASAVLGQNNGTNSNGMGVYGSHAGGGQGVFGSSVSGIGVQGTSTSGTGVNAASGSTAIGATAILGTITSTSPGSGSAGVYGQNNGTGDNGIGVVGIQNGSGFGVYGYTLDGIGAFGNSPNGTGIYGSSSSSFGVDAHSTSNTALRGQSDATTDNASAILGVITSTSPGNNSAAVQGTNNSTTANGVGVIGTQTGSGDGVYGFTPSGIGVHGASTSGTGVYAESTSGKAIDAYSYNNADSASALTATMDAATPGKYSTAIYALNYDTGSTGIGVYGIQKGDGYGVAGQSDGAGTGVYGLTNSGTGVLGATGASNGNWAVFGNGNIGATGTKSAIVPAANGTYRTLYCLESPECWFEDFGSATLTNGVASVLIDPLFAATVDTSLYHIFLTPHGDSNGLYVSAVTTTGFAVREQRNGSSTLSFTYRVVARRKDVTAPRLALVELPKVPASMPAPARPQPQSRPTVPPAVASSVATPRSQQGNVPQAVTPQTSPVVPPPVSATPVQPGPAGK